MEKRKLDPEYDEQCKKKATESKAKFDVRKKQEISEKGIFLISNKANSSARIDIDSGRVEQDPRETSFKRYRLEHH